MFTYRIANNWLFDVTVGTGYEISSTSDLKRAFTLEGEKINYAMAVPLGVIRIAKSLLEKHNSIYVR